MVNLLISGAFITWIVINIILLIKNRSINKLFFSHVVMLFIIEVSTFDCRILLVGERTAMTAISLGIIYGAYTNIKKRLYLLTTAYLAIPLIAIAWQIINPYTGGILPHDVGNWDHYILGQASLGKWHYMTGEFLRSYISLGAFITWIIAFKTIATNYNVYNILSNIVKYYKIFVIYGVIEFILKDIIEMPNITYKFTVPFLGVDPMRDSSYGYQAVERGFGYMLHGFAWEASFYVLALFMVAMIILILHFIDIDGIKKESHSVMFLTLLLLMVFSGGFTCIWSIAMLGLIYAYFYVKKNAISNKILLQISCGCIVVVITGILLLQLVLDDDVYMWERLMNTIEVAYVLVNNPQAMSVLIAYGGEGVGSALARLYSVVHCFGIFMDRPLFGLGLSSTWAYATTPSMLVSFGGVGVLVWYLLATFPRKDSFKYDTKFFFLVVLFAGIPTGVLCYESGFGMSMSFVLLMEAAMLIRKSY